ncbi:hypothetical protein CMUS01_11046 [Colletotrichum musicola]|uniref:Uncharacterized protein n=1 Tax=Colletotrichum musicola TaxID=2175873 RepID=A0A8H6N7R6_9PEZI|nr:hypothetical protein CMUS01_11046 [Colletotrichum musicola]
MVEGAGHSGATLHSNGSEQAKSDLPPLHARPVMLFLIKEDAYQEDVPFHQQAERLIVAAPCPISHRTRRSPKRQQRALPLPAPDRWAATRFLVRVERCPDESSTTEVSRRTGRRERDANPLCTVSNGSLAAASLPVILRPRLSNAKPPPTNRKRGVSSPISIRLGIPHRRAGKPALARGRRTMVVATLDHMAMGVVLGTPSEGKTTPALLSGGTTGPGRP